MYPTTVNTMRLTWLRSADDLKWYKFRLNSLGEQLVLEIGQDFDIRGAPHEIVMVQFSRSGLSGTLVVQSV